MHVEVANKENVTPSSDPVANVRNAARDALASHIDGSAKASKIKRCRDQLSDAEKIESLFVSLDSIDVLLSLALEVKVFIQSVSVNGGSSLDLAVDVLDFVASSGKDLLSRIRKTTNNTKSKSKAASAHNKLTKVSRMQFKDEQVQRRVLSSTSPRRMLQMALSNAKKRLNQVGSTDDTIKGDFWCSCSSGKA